MKTCKPLALVLLPLLATATVLNVNANSLDEYRVYKYALAGFEVWFEYPFEAYPNETITVNVTIKAQTDLIVNWTQIELYTLHNLTKDYTLFNSIIYVSEPKSLLGGKSLNETSYEVKIPDYATNALYGKMILKWTIKGTDESTFYEREPTFIMGYLRNPELERLRSKVPELERENAELKGNVTDLNNTLTELLNNLTDVKNRYEGELSGTRSVVTILAITTIFFVATTAYLVMRKPKEYW